MNFSQIDLKSAAIKHEKHLYAILKTSKAELENVIMNKQSYYYSFNRVKTDKRDQIVYKNGMPKLRTINATKGKLNYFQIVIAKVILSKILLPSNIKGAVKGNSNISNAQAHLGKHYKFKTDMKNYFPSIHPDRVYKMFIENGCSSRVATLLTHITTNKHQLPQGTPCSSAIANLVFVPNDLKIIQYCDTHKLTYTRFVDDLTFSSHFDFKDKLLSLIHFIIEDGFKISSSKTIYTAGSLEITGVLTKQNVLDATKEYKILVTDETINPQKTAARKKYIERIKATTKNLSRKKEDKNNK